MNEDEVIAIFMEKIRMERNRVIREGKEKGRG